MEKTDLSLNVLQLHPYRTIFKLALPLILTMSGVMIMQFVDSLFLAWYSAEAMAASVAAGMASFLPACLFQGISGYTSTFTAHYCGCGRTDRIAATIWQGIYLSFIAGLIMVGIGFAAHPLFAMVGHTPEVVALEVSFFSIMCWGSIFSIISSAISGFFIGRGDTKTLMFVQVGGLLINAGLDYCLIFGNLGFPRLGIVGAACATVTAQASVTVALAVIFFSKRNRSEYRTWQERRFNGAIFVRLMKFGFPSGFRFFIEIFAWTAFVIIVGRIGTVALAASSIAWRINGIAFFPIIGLSQAVAILVGNAQGAGQSALSVKTTRQGLIIAEIWMVFAAGLFVLIPGQLYGLFGEAAGRSAEFAEIVSTGVIILRFVALYSLVDACNIVLTGVLQAAGDTRWTFIISAGLHLAFFGMLLAADFFGWGLYAEWTIATVFVIVLATAWVIRFKQGAWKSIHVVEPAIDDVPVT